MAGYIIGLVIGVIIFLLQNFKPTSNSFRVLFLILTIAFIWGISYANLGYWNIAVIPIGVIFLCFIAAFIFPYGAQSAKTEYDAINGRNYFAEMNENDKIGRIYPPMFKQTYDRIMSGILSHIVSSQSELQELGNLLYSKNFYPISSHTKKEVLQHIRQSIETVASFSPHGKSIQIKAEQNIEHIFNTFVSVMAIHEEATREKNEIMDTK